MDATEPIQRVRIYLSERDTLEGQPLYLIALDWLQREGATGATAIRGIAGFGANRGLLPAAATRPAAAPLVIEWIDRADRIARLLPALDKLLPDALITVEEVRVYRAVLRSTGPFGERTVGAVVAGDVVTMPPDAPLAQALRQVIDRPQPVLPVVEGHHLVGSVSLAGLERHAALPPLRLLRAVAESERQALLAALPAATVSQFMSTESRAMTLDAPIAQAVGTLVEWGLDALPVIDHAGAFVGLFGVEQALRAALESRPAAGQVRDVAPPPVRLLMQTAIPTVAATTPAAEAVAQLCATPAHFLVVIDGERPIGLLDDVQLVSRLADPALRSALLAAFLAPQAALEPALQQHLAGQTAAGLPLVPPPTIMEDATQDAALQRLIAQQLEQLLVVDAENRLIGLIGRGGLLRALVQEGGG